jgi:Brp/Blh family beta-carotene 15,15'-monooxygenase
MGDAAMRAGDGPDEPRHRPATSRVHAARSTTLRARLFAVALVPSWAAIVLTGGAAAALGPPPLVVQLGALVASAIVLGLPHGAVDHLTLPRARGEAATRGDYAAVGVLYLLAGGAYAAVWFLAPLLAAVAFVALTWLHWGQGDVYPLVDLVPGDHPGDRTGRVLTAAVRGGLPMVVPLLAFPAWYRRVLGWFVAPFGGSPAALAPLFSPASRLALGAGFAALTLVALARGFRRSGGTTAWRVDAAETLLLWGFFLVVPPLLSVGVYFCLWHALRHVVRLLALDDDATAAVRSARPLAAFARFGRDAAPLTAAALVLLGALWAVVPVPPSAPGEAVGLYMALVAVLTLPHVVVVGLLDRVQGVWVP